MNNRDLPNSVINLSEKKLEALGDLHRAILETKDV